MVVVLSNNNNNNSSSSSSKEKEKEEEEEKGVVVAKEKEKEGRRMLVGLIIKVCWNWKWSCGGEVKVLVLLTALLFLCSFATLLQFLPYRFFLLDLRHCLSSTPTPTTTSNSKSIILLTNNSNTTTVTNSCPPQLPVQEQQQLEVEDDGVVKRGFHPYGSAAYNFIFMSAYRGGPHTFAVLGLSSKPLHLYSNPTYHCLWAPHHHPHNPISTPGHKILPDWGYGRVYTVVVVNCTFPLPSAAADGQGGQLLLRATGDSILALEETPQDFASFTAQFTSPMYDYVYCGSSLYGNLSPQRVREWLAYHVRLLGARSHFVIHNAGGVHEGVMRVLRPWMDKGFVTLQDIKEQERFDGYYHNQFLIVNDCLHRYRFAAKWILFFDLDEFIFAPNKSTIKSVLHSFSNFTQFTIQQMPMSNKLCLSHDAPTTFRKWGFEKLVYKDVKRGMRRDRKYGVQPRNVFATGVHMSQNTVGKTTHKTEGRIKYFHYHGTISERREPCRQFVNSTQITVDGIPYVMDTTLRNIAGAVKRFELKMIGSTLQRTRQ